MEEILASIRKIITDEPGAESDASSGKQTAQAAEPASGFDDASFDEDEAYEAGDGDDAGGEAFAESGMTVGERAAVSHVEAVANYSESLSDTFMGSGPKRAEFSHSLAEDFLMDMQTNDKAADVLGKLSDTLNMRYAEARTLEDVVKDLLNPLLKEWLDRNLQPIVEQKVEEGVERIIRRAGERNF